jgi:hypothetical protein
MVKITAIVIDRKTSAAPYAETQKFFALNDDNDVARLGAGDDVFQCDPGDGSDTVEGQDGTDRMLFNGSNTADNFDIYANGSRVLMT